MTQRREYVTTHQYKHGLKKILLIRLIEKKQSLISQQKNNGCRKHQHKNTHFQVFI